MDRERIARVLMTTVLIGSAALSFVIEWRPAAVLNPAWPPHAQFHAVLGLFSYAGVAVMATWLLWRKSAEPALAFKVGGLVLLSAWAPVFFIKFLVPESSPWGGPPNAIPHIAGVPFSPNLLVAAVFLLIGAAAYRLARPEEES